MPHDTIKAEPARRGSGDERRCAIAEAARDLIIERGFEGLRTRDIAERVGINVATLHYHVPSKEALIGLVAETIRDHFRAQGMRHSRTGANGLERLRLELADFRETLVEKPDMVVVFSEMLDRARRHGAAGDVITPMYDFWHQQFVGLLALGVADGSLRPDLDPAAAADMLTGALGDFWRRCARDPARYDRMVAELERSVVNTLSPPKDTQR
jgi:AcrR family transcriptional regulator